MRREEGSDAKNIEWSSLRDSYPVSVEREEK